MSKQKNIERAKTEGIHRGGQIVPLDKVPLKCIFPPCQTNVLVDKAPPGIPTGSPAHLKQLHGLPMCEKHQEWLQFYFWCQINVKVEMQRTPGGLVLPGHEKFKQTIGGHEVKGP